jgi:adenylate cyclase
VLADDLHEVPRPDHARQSQAEARLRLIPPQEGEAGRAVSRLAVVVAADVVDFTRHMATDEAGTHVRFSAFCADLIRPGVARRGGRVFKHTGDGFMAVFWSAVDAVWFALDFQSAVRVRNARRAGSKRLEFRLAINLGDVIVDQDDVFGHNVNVAARMQAVAQPGGVLVSHAVFSSVRDRRLLFEDAGDLSLKGLHEKVHGFSAKAGARARP